jgi:hypothetical protein
MMRRPRSEPVAHAKAAGELDQMKILALILVISVLGNVFLLYRLIDTGVTVTYGAAELGYRAKKLKALEKLLPLLLSDTSRDALLSAARKAELEIIEKQGDGTYIGGLQFVFSGNRLTAVNAE